MKPATCWAICDDKTHHPYIYTISATRKEAIQKLTGGFSNWNAYYREGYRVSKFNLVLVKK